MTFLQKLKMTARPALKRLETFLGTDIKYLGVGGFWLTASKFVSTGGAFITSVLFANLLPQESYGTYRYVLSYVSIFTITTLPGIDTALIRSINLGGSKNFLNALAVKMKWGMLGALVSACFAAYFFWKDDSTLGIAFLIVAAFLPFMDPFYLYMSYYNAVREYGLFTKSHLIVKTAVVIAISVTVLLSKSVLALLFVYFLIHTLMRFVFLKKAITKTRMHAPDDGRGMIAYGKHLTAMQVLSIISSATDKILIFQSIGPAGLAGFYLALVPFKQTQGFFSSINVLALPKFSNTDPTVLRSTLLKKVLKAYLVVIPTVALYALFARFTFSLLYPKYLEFVQLSIFFMGLLMFFPLTIFHTALTALGKTRALYTISTTTAVARILVLLAVVPRFGFWGAAFCIFGSMALNCGLNVFFFFRKDPGGPASPGRA